MKNYKEIGKGEVIPHLAKCKDVYACVFAKNVYGIPQMVNMRFEMSDIVPEILSSDDVVFFVKVEE